MRLAHVRKLLLTLICLALAAPAMAETKADRAAKDKILLFGNGSEPQNLDPHTVRGVTENHIISALIEGLIAYHPTDQALPEPGMADRWEHNLDASEWTFHIRDGAKWSNGDPVKAADFVFSFHRILSPNLAADYADQLYIMKGAEDFHKGKLTDFDAVGVKALDDQNLRITLVGPTPYFLSALTHYSWYPVHPATILKFGKIDDRVSAWTRPENFVGNGPFKLKEWKVNEVITVERNPLYWDAKTVKLNGIQYYPIEDQNTEERAFRAGDLHITNEVPLDKIPGYRRDNKDLILVDPYLGTYFYRLNVNKPALKDVRVREALNLALDRDSIVENITRGGQLPALGYTPQGMGRYKTPELMSYDPDKARKLLAEAGYPDGKGFPKYEILINTSESHKTVAEAIQQMWKQELGIDIGIRNEEWKVYLDSQTNMKYDITRSGWIGDYMDPVTFLTMWTTGNGNNNTGWSNAEYDSLIKQSFLEADEAKRFALLEKAETILLKNPPFATIYWYTRVYLKSAHVVNWNSLLLDNHNFKYIDLK